MLTFQFRRLITTFSLLWHRMVIDLWVWQNLGNSRKSPDLTFNTSHSGYRSKSDECVDLWMQEKIKCVHEHLPRWCLDREQMLHAQWCHSFQKVADIWKHGLHMLTGLPLDDRGSQLELAHGHHITLLTHFTQSLTQKHFQLGSQTQRGEHHNLANISTRDKPPLQLENC